MFALNNHQIPSQKFSFWIKPRTAFIRVLLKFLLFFRDSGIVTSHCILRGYFCDGIVDCQDGSDEAEVGSGFKCRISKSTAGTSLSFCCCGDGMTLRTCRFDFMFRPFDFENLFSIICRKNIFTYFRIIINPNLRPAPGDD